MKALASFNLLSFQNVLLATDLSPSSEAALEFARILARDHGAHVHTIHVTGPDNYQLLNPAAFATTFVERRDLGRGSRALRTLLDGLPCEVPVHGSRVWEVIGDVASRNEIDLLIVGSHARTGIPKMVFGSVAEEVFRDVSCPVLTVGEDVPYPVAGGLSLETILLATDCNPSSHAAAYAARISHEMGAKLIVLHVAKKGEPHEPGFAWRHMKATMAEVAPQIMALPQRPMFIVEYGDPASRILHIARDLQADLIVLGAHHPRDVRTAAHLPWGTASRIIAKSRCPVLTLRDRQAAALVAECEREAV